ncbi:polyA-binding protein interacting protein 2 isoform X2 [Lasioglossum baleicum]|uniref:polyA-binding protein interacting protein 2 isoform X2 n=1 Tax=Lasioglossum baleicum TaxID=434251 RepID=UPI003FCCC43C
MFLYYIFETKMKIPTSGSGSDYGTETDIIAYMENNFEPDLDGPEAETSSDFSEYLWMENEEEFDKEVIQQLMEEELTEECLKAMWEDEKQLERNSIDNEIWQQLDRLSLPDDIAEWSTLNPNAAEFVPAFKPAVTSVSTPPEVTAESS